MLSWDHNFATLPAMLIDLSDETLMLRYCDGDLSAFKELYRRHSGNLYRFISWRAPRKDWADEVAQECWISIHHARAKYQPQASFRTFLYQIARNRLIDLLRQHHMLLASDLGDDGSGNALFDRLDHLAARPGKDATPETEMIQKQEIIGLHAAINALPGDQKDALILQQFNGLSIEEIAQISEVPTETVKSRLRYAMRKLREQLVGHTGTREELV
jgi:RNA polymerase sigma factor (sigma-70 family)